MPNSSVMSLEHEKKATSFSNRIGLVLVLAMMSVVVVVIFGLITIILGGGWGGASKEKKHDIYKNPADRGLMLRG